MLKGELKSCNVRLPDKGSSRQCYLHCSTFDSVQWWQALAARYLQYIKRGSHTHRERGSTREAGKVRFERRTAHRERKSSLAHGHFGPGEPSACLPEWNCHCREQSEHGSSPSRPAASSTTPFATRREPSTALLLQLTAPSCAPSPHFPLNPSIASF